jgi:hypothetical protein
MHEQNLCPCEVVFDTEERGRKMRPRPAKGKGKMKEIALGEYIHGHATSSVGGEGTSMSQGHYTAEDPANRPHQVNYTMLAESDQQRRQQEWEAKMAAYEYVGYFPGSKRLGGALAHIEKGYGFPEGGYVRQDQLWEGQLRVGQPGSGMKWYPEQGSPAPVLPTLPALPPIPGPMAFAEPSSRAWQRASSEPIEPTEYTGSPNDTPHMRNAELKKAVEPSNLGTMEDVDVSELPSGPIVVSSDMAKTVSQ